MGFNGFYIMGFYSDLMGYYWYIPSGNVLHSHARWPIEIDDLPNLKVVDLSMANCSITRWSFGWKLWGNSKFDQAELNWVDRVWKTWEIY